MGVPFLSYVKVRSAALAVLTAVLVMLLSASPAAHANLRDGELRIRWWMDMITLDPPQIRDSLATEVAYHIYSTLVRIKPGTFDEIVPDLAERWEISPDGLRYTFHLRKGVQWHHGYGEVTARDVQFSLLRHLDPEVASQFAPEASNIQDVRVLDDYTVEVIMKEPYPGFLMEFLAYRPGFIVNQRALEELGARYSERPVGSGAYILENWSPRDRVELVRNPDYYGETGAFHRVTYIVIPEESVFEVALERGEVDMGYFLDADVQSRAVANPRFETVTIVAPRTFYLQLNFEKEPFNNPLVRRALWMALDKDLIVEAVLDGQGVATDTLLNPHVFGYLADRANEYDPDKARELLKEAGYPNGFSATLLIYPPYGIPDMAAAMQDMWRQVGINVEIVQREWAQHVELRRSGNFDLALQPQLRLGPDQYVSPLLHSASIPYPNASRYANPEMDALIERARVETNDDIRRQLYHDIQRKVHEEVPVIPVLNPVFVLAHRPEIGNAKPGLLTINVTGLTLDN